ncbi:MAG: hypothetical protein IPG55_06765 [Saprospiraceae bacterium]|nr:hypothetical protein [Candidatus Defluviibacterium haderslevense]MBK7245680.1 hypothetical protein [Candidatus Defluviibacterium haderslevense]
MEKMTIKNKRLKMSPGGVVTLNVATRKALGMKVNEPANVSVTVDDNCIVINGNLEADKKTWRVSKSGQLVINAEAKELLSKNEHRHYWVMLDDNKREARLMPY